MCYRAIIFLCLSFPCCLPPWPVAARAQVPAGGGIFGQVIELDTRRELPDVVVRVIGSGYEGRTGGDGRYSIRGLTPGAYNVEYLLPGYERKRLDGVAVRAGEATRTDVTLALELFELPLLEVMADPLAGLDQTLLLDRMESNIMFDGLSAARMSQLGAGSAAEALTKVTGTTIVEGKFAVIRGLADRYTSATLNGGEIPSADPYRKAAQLDLFPSAMIDQIVVNKTFTPDQPGGFTGGSVDIRTKSFPEQFVFTFGTGVAYNTEASMRDDFLSYPGGATDWLGYDDGTRAIPDELAGEALPTVGEINNPTIPLPVRRAQAVRLDQLTRSFDSGRLGPTESRSSVDRKLSLTLGDQFRIYERRVGYFASLGHDLEQRAYREGEQGRYEGGVTPLSVSRDDQSVTTVNLGGTLALAFELHPLHQLDFNFIYNQQGEDRARIRTGRNFFTGNAETEIQRQETLHWTERNLQATQFKGRHEFPAWLGSKTEWLVSLSTTTQDEPDQRFINFFNNPDGAGGYVNELKNNSLPEPIRPTRTFRELAEDNVNLRLDETLLVPLGDERELTVKLGAYHSASERDVQVNDYIYDSPQFIAGPAVDEFANYFLREDQFGFTTSGGRYLFDRALETGFGNNAYFGDSKVQAVYLMNELPLAERWRVMAGVRLETTDLRVDSFNGVQTAQALIQEEDWLPAAGIIHSPRPDMNVRLHYGRTLARPTFRELAPNRSYDPVASILVEGNPNLLRTIVDNYDVRWEWFPQPGEVVSAGFFFKSLKDPIERTLVSAKGDILTFENRAEATVWGIELEARKNLAFASELLEAFSMGFNFAWIESAVPLTETELINKRSSDPRFPAERPLFDQSPYVANVDLTFDHPRSGTQVTLAYAIAGPRIYITTSTGPDVYEQPSPQLDLFISQRLDDHWKLRFSAKNLLFSETFVTYGEDADALAYARTSRSLTLGLSLNYSY